MLLHRIPKTPYSLGVQHLTTPSDRVGLKLQADIHNRRQYLLIYRYILNEYVVRTNSSTISPIKRKN